jgi:hypothetical protein
LEDPQTPGGGGAGQAREEEGKMNRMFVQILISLGCLYAITYVLGTFVIDLMHVKPG